MEYAIYIAIGVAVVPTLKFVGWLCYCTKWAIRDTAWTFRNCELKEGVSKWAWVGILRRKFSSSWKDTAFGIGKRY